MGGFHWKYMEDYVVGEEPEKPYECPKTRDPKIAKKIKESRLIHSEKNGRKVLCIETEIVYNNAGQAENTLGIRGVHAVCNGKTKTCAKLHWRYLD